MSRLRLPSRTGAGHAPLAMDAIGFDVYGTLVDPLGIEPALREIAGDRAGELARAWRARQIEYSFRRSLMGAWAPFEVCTRDALQHATLATSGMALTSEAGDRLLALYGRLPAFPDAAPGLRALRERGHRLVAFSNGSAHAVREVLGHSGLLEQLDDVVSVAEVRIFKPHLACTSTLPTGLDSPPAIPGSSRATRGTSSVLRRPGSGPHGSNDRPFPSTPGVDLPS